MSGELKADPLEIEANLFAELLLVPRFLLVKSLKKIKGVHPSDEKKLDRLAKDFRVSIGLMSKRLTDEKLWGMAVSK